MHNWQHQQNELGIRDTAFISLIKFLKLYSILNHTRMSVEWTIKKGNELKQFISHIFYYHTLNMISICFIVCYAGWNIRNPGSDAVPFRYRLSFSGKSAKHMERLCLGLEGWNGNPCCHQSSSNTAFSQCQYHRLEWCKLSGIFTSQVNA